MAEVIIYVDPDASGSNDGSSWADAYTGLETALDTEAIDLVTAEDNYVFLCRATAGSADTTRVSLDGYTTSSDYDIEIRDHDGTYSLEFSNSTGPIFDIRDNNVTLNGLYLYNTDTGNGSHTLGFSVFAVTNNLIKNCKIRVAQNGSGVYITQNSDITLENCVIWCSNSTQGSSSEGIYASTTATTCTVQITNCTIYNFNDGIERDAGTFDVLNTVVFNCADDFDGTFNSISYCASEDGDGTNAVTITQTANDYAALVIDALNGDFSVTDSSSQLYNAGNNTGATTVDITDRPRPQGTTVDIGAYELDVGAGAKFTVDTYDKHKMAVVLHDVPFQSGDPDSPTDYLEAYLKCEQLYNTNYLKDEVSGNDSSLFTITNETGVSFGENGVLISDVGQGSIDFASSGNLVDEDKGTLIFDYTPTHDSGSFINSGGYLFRFEGNPSFRAGFSSNGTYLSFIYAGNAVPTLSPNFKGGTTYRLTFIWYNASGGGTGNLFHSVAINTGEYSSEWNIADDQTSLDTILSIGNNNATSDLECEGSIKNIKILNDVILPYGAYFTGNGSVSSTLHHKDILTYVNCSQTNGEAVDIGSGNVTASGVTYGTGVGGVANAAVLIDAATDEYSFDASESNNTVNGDIGKVCFWYKKTGSDIAYERILHWEADSSPSFTDFMVFRQSTNDEIQMNINGSSAYLDFPAFDGNWHWIELIWDHANSYRAAFIDDILQESASTSWTSIALTDGVFHLGRRYDGGYNTTGYFQHVYITNNPNTPQIPTANGVPLNVPLLGDA